MSAIALSFSHPVLCQCAVLCVDAEDCVVLLTVTVFVVRTRLCGSLLLVGAIEMAVCYYYGSKDPRGYKLKKLKSKCRMVIGPAGQLAECRAKARS